MVISMERPKILFVFNPRSGKAKIKNKLCDIIDIFVKAGYEVTVYPTQEEGDAIRAVRDKREDMPCWFAAAVTALWMKW